MFNRPKNPQIAMNITHTGSRGKKREVFQYTLSAEDFVEKQAHDLPACQLLPAAEVLPVKLVLV